jgi:uncharacterized protein DUF2017
MFRRRSSGLVAVFAPAEAQVLRQCVSELAALLNDDLDRDDPAVERLFPDVYPENPEDAAEFRRLTESDLLEGKRDQAKTVLTDLLSVSADPDGGEVRLDDDHADVWLRALTDLRLALGTRLGVEDDTDIEAELDAAVGRNPTSPRVGQLSVYAFLSYLQESLVEALTH